MNKILLEIRNEYNKSFFTYSRFSYKIVNIVVFKTILTLTQQ